MVRRIMVLKWIWMMMLGMLFVGNCGNRILDMVVDGRRVGGMNGECMGDGEVGS